MRWKELLIFSIVVMVIAPVFAQGVETYVMNFENGYSLPLYIDKGKNTTTQNGWSGLSLYIGNDNGSILAYIYNYNERNDILYSYNQIRRIYFEFWFAGIGDFQAKFQFKIGSIKQTEEKMNYYFMNINGKVNGIEYKSMTIKDIQIGWGKDNGKQNVTSLIHSTSGYIATKRFVLDINLINYPDEIIYTLIYPKSNGGSSENIAYQEKPLLVGSYTYFPKDGLKSPICMQVNFTSIPKNGGILIDNLMIEYVKQQISGTPYPEIIGLVSMFAVPPIIYYGYKKRKKA